MYLYTQRIAMKNSSCAIWKQHKSDSGKNILALPYGTMSNSFKR